MSRISYEMARRAQGSNLLEFGSKLGSTCKATTRYNSDTVSFTSHAGGPYGVRYTTEHVLLKPQATRRRKSDLCALDMAD